MVPTLTTLPGLLNGHPGAAGIIGDSILALSNQQLGGGALSLAATPDNPGYGLPLAIHDLTATPNQVSLVPSPNPAGAQSTATYLFANNEAWRGLSTALGASTLTGGTEFSSDLTRRAAEFAHVGTEIAATPWFAPVLGEGLFAKSNHDALSNSLQDILSASTRSHDADAQVFLAPDGASTYHTFADFDWADKGKAAGGLTNWIADDTIAAHQHGTEDQPANDAAAKPIHLITDGGFRDGGSDQQLFHDFSKNPELATSLGRVAQANVSAFTEPAAQNSNTGVVGGHLEIGADARKDLLTQIGAKPEALHAFAGAAGSQEQQLIHDPDLSPGASAYRSRILEETFTTLSRRHSTSTLSRPTMSGPRTRATPGARSRSARPSRPK
ncbi:TPR repeat region-containing protein [Fodinicola feengrottensis]|uniref:TPR repeat domain-containing protein n=1 Tax=Fodinicola feengrottensis TaxID=435914 RepID=A0ABN2IPY3_9ACTN|nr:hypothetical protein [Fodinicola feengrottensis]